MSTEQINVWLTKIACIIFICNGFSACWFGKDPSVNALLTSIGGLKVLNNEIGILLTVFGVRKTVNMWIRNYILPSITSTNHRHYSHSFLHNGMHGIQTHTCKKM